MLYQGPLGNGTERSAWYTCACGSAWRWTQVDLAHKNVNFVMIVSAFLSGRDVCAWNKIKTINQGNAMRQKNRSSIPDMGD